MKLITKNLLWAVTLFFASCASNTSENDQGTSLDSNLISGELVTNPRLSGDSTVGLPTLDFVDTFHDFGSISEGEIVTYDFEFSNNGTIPLIVSNVLASCGCTTPEKPEDPIMPGKQGIIKVSFDSNGRPGTQNKTVTVMNNSVRAQRELKIKVEVRPKS